MHMKRKHCTLKILFLVKWLNSEVLAKFKTIRLNGTFEDQSQSDNHIKLQKTKFTLQDRKISFEVFLVSYYSENKNICVAIDYSIEVEP